MPSRTDSTQTIDTIKAIILDGSVFALAGPDYYVSIVFKITASSTTISHYADDGLLDFTEHLYYDSLQRVTKYSFDRFTIYQYRHFAYSGTGTIPARITDSLFIGGLIVTKYNTVSSTNPGGGTQLNMEYELLHPTPEYGIDTVWFDSAKLLVREKHSSGIPGRFNQAVLHYNANSLLDSALVRLDQSPLVQEGSDFSYSTIDNPLHGLSKMVYKNLAPYIPYSHGASGYGKLLSLDGFEPFGLLQSKVVSKLHRYFYNPSDGLEVSYTANLNNGVVESLTIHSIEHSYPNSPSGTGAIRFRR